MFLALIPLNLHAEEQTAAVSGDISAEAGTLWVEDSASAWFWRNGLNLTLEKIFFIDVELGKVTANLPWLSGSLFGGGARFGLDLPAAGFTFNAGYFDHSPLQAAIVDAELTTGGGRGFFYSIELPVHTGPFSVVPSFVHAEASADNGDLYWFFGKADIPSLHILGGDLRFNHHRRYTHELGFRQLLTDIVITSNENKPLFDSELDGTGVWYRLAVEGRKVRFSGTLGWLSFSAAAHGGLSTANQPYFLFPFRFCNVSVDIEAQAGFAMASFQHDIGIFRYNLDLGALHIFESRSSVTMHYKMKNLFGGNELYDEITPNITGTGGVFALVKVSLPALTLGKNKKQKLSLGIQKALALPWGYENLLSSAAGVTPEAVEPGPAGSVSSAELNKWIRTALLSGISVQASLSW